VSFSLYVELLDLKTRAWSSALCVLGFMLLVPLGVKSCSFLQGVMFSNHRKRCNHNASLINLSASKFCTKADEEQEFILTDIDQQSYGTEPQEAQEDD
jgi:hypothetical protein